MLSGYISLFVKKLNINSMTEWFLRLLIKIGHIMITFFAFTSKVQKRFKCSNMTQQFHHTYMRIYIYTHVRHFKLNIYCSNVDETVNDSSMITCILVNICLSFLHSFFTPGDSPSPHPSHSSQCGLSGLTAHPVSGMRTLTGLGQ